MIAMFQAARPGASGVGASPGLGAVRGPAPPVGASDAELVQLMSTGDTAALAVLYERYAAGIMKTVVAILGESSQSQDVLQDVFMEAWRVAEQYDERRGTVAAWLKLRARSRALDKVRAGKRFLDVESSEDETAPAPSSERRAARMNLFEALEAVSLEEREVLVLGYCEGFTCSEMAEELGIPIGTVKSRTRTAIAKLRAYWERPTQ